MGKLERNRAIIDIKIKCDGTEIKEPNADINVWVWKQINKISKANVKFKLINMSVTKAYEFAEKGSFDTGKDLEIELGYKGGSPKNVFKGIITRYGLNRNQDNQIVLEIEGSHKAIKMTTVRKCEIHEGKDSDIITKLINNAGVAKTVDSAGEKHKHFIQYDCTDWDLAMDRAQACGLIALTNTEKVEFVKPKLSGGPVVEVEDRNGLKAFSTYIDGVNQFKKVEVKTWDHSAQKVLKATSPKVSSGIGGDLSQSKLAGIFNSTDFQLHAVAKMTNDELKKWAESRLQLSEMSRMQGHVLITGTADVNCGDMIKIAGTNKHFDGNLYAGGVEHNACLTRWDTEVKIGLNPYWHIEEVANVNTLSAGMFPAIKGLQIGKVISIGNDKKEGQFRVELKVPTISDKPLFARISTFYASNEFGAFFMPEVDDEVIVGFVDEDPRNPIILGSVYSSKLKPPETVEKKNEIKSLTTRSKLKITFDEKDKIITIETPAKNIVTMDDKAKKIEIVDCNKNKIVMEKAGITIDSSKDINIKAKGKINMESKLDTTIEAKTNLTLKGLVLKAEAKTNLEAKANAMAKIQSSGILQMQGSLVKIN